MKNKERVIIAFSGLFLLLILLLSISAPFGFMLSNADRESFGNVLLSQNDELYLILPKDLHGSEVQDFEISLKDKKEEEIQFRALLSHPPYSEVDASGTYESVIISIAPNSFRRGDYSLAISKNNRIIKKHDLKLRHEFVAPWDY